MSHLSRIALALCLAASGAHAQTPAPAPAPAPASATPPANTAAASKASATEASAGATARKPNYATSKDPAPGGAPNLVWANSHTKRYHCPGGKYYGRTYQGSYVDETDAIEDGYKPSNRTGCSK
jgi:hypothetical protein